MENDVQIYVEALIQHANEDPHSTDKEKAALVAVAGLAEIAISALVRIADALEAK